MDINRNKAALAFANFSPMNHSVHYQGFLIDPPQTLQEIPLHGEESMVPHLRWHPLQLRLVGPSSPLALYSLLTKVSSMPWQKCQR